MPANNARDPRQDPMPGDVLIYGPQWQQERVEVMSIDGKWVHAKYGNTSWVHSEIIGRWRHIMAGAEVVHAAPE